MKEMMSKNNDKNKLLYRIHIRIRTLELVKMKSYENSL